MSDGADLAQNHEGGDNAETLLQSDWSRVAEQ
jgi:hypothetical protein